MYGQPQYLPIVSIISVSLTHCGLVTPYGDVELGQHWLRFWLVAWRHQAITWTVDLSSVRSLGINLRALSLDDVKIPINKRPVGLYSSAAYWNHDDQGKGSSSELDMSEYIMFGLDWACLTTTRPSGHISRRINNVWPMLRQWSFSWSFQGVCLPVLYVRKG